jgi:TP901 family phage tail tape measure protein
MAREYTREIYLYINGKQINNDIKSIRAEMQLLVNEQAKMILGSKEYVAHGERIRSLKGILNEHTNQLKNVNRTWGQTMNAMGDWFNRFQALAVAAIAGVVGIVMAFRKTTEASMLMEERLDNLSALTGLTGRSLEWLGNKAKESSISITETGVRIKQSATDIVDAYTKVGSQRPELLKNKESLAAVTEAAIVLSEAAKSKLEPATLALTTTMNQFNLGASQANRIINTLAAGSLVGAGEIPYLTEVMEKSGTTANLMGISIEQMTGIIEGVAPKFQMAEVAGTALDRVLLEMRKRGIGYKDGVFDINRAIDELSERYKKGETSVKIFGVHQAKMGEILVMNRDQINQFTKGVTGTQVAFEQAGKNTDNMAAKLAQAKNKVTLMYIEVGEKLAPALIFSTNTLNIFLRTMMALPKIISDNRVLIVSLVGALLAYNGVLIKNTALSVWDTAVALKTSIALRLAAAARGLDAAMTIVQSTQVAALTIWQRTAITLQYAWNAAMLANPVGMVIAGITALVAGLMIYSRNNKEHLAMEARKKEVTDSLTTSNYELQASYQMLVEDQDQLNRMSLDQKRNLQTQLEETIKLAEANYDLQKSKIGEVRADNSKLTAWQFLTTWSNSGKVEKARANGAKVVEGMNKILLNMGDTIQSLKDKKLTLTDILSAEATGDKIGTESLSMLQEKLDQYTLALNSAKIGTEEYLRLKKKVEAADAQLKKARGSDIDPTDEDAKRKDVLKDLVSLELSKRAIIKGRYAQALIDKDLYLQELDALEIDSQSKTIVRLRAHGFDTSKEEEKLQDTLVDIRDAGIKETEKAMKELQDQYDKFYEDWDKDTISAMKDMTPTSAFAQQLLEDDYLNKKTMEGRRARIEKDYQEDIIGATERDDKLRELDKETQEKKFQQLEDYARGANTILDAIGTMQEAAKNRELAVAGLTDKQKAAIEKKYALRQQKIAIAQTIIEGIMEVARVNSNVGVNADLTQTLRAFLTGAAVVRTVANVALIQSQQFASGRYPVMGADDKQIYQASLLGKVRTGIYNKPTLGLFSEKEPEIVIDGPTTRNIKANFPQILSAIQAARVPQFAGGLYPELGTGQQAFPVELKDLLIANYRMMQEVREAHQRPALVSFQSLRERQHEYERIKRSSSMGDSL